MKRLFLTAVAVITMLIGANAQSKIAHINSAELMQAMPEMKDFEKKLQDYEGVLRAQLETMQTELQTKYQQYMTDTASPPAIMEIKKKKLEDLQADIQQFSQSAEQDMLKKKEELYMPIYTKAKTAINKVAKAKGFDYVLDSSEGLGVLVVSTPNDLMNDVKKELLIN
jgi:outer membrane protein